MTDPVSHFSPRTEAPHGRLWTALAASASLHLFIAAVFLPGVPRRPGPEQAIPVISARLAVAEATVGSFAPTSRLPRGPARQRHAQDEAAVPSRPAPELAYYPARELDVFPRPLAPLELHPMGSAGRIRAVVKIDDLGFVKDVEIAGTGSAAREALRATLAAARFAPALKDERPVGSRIVLDFSFVGY